MTCNIFHVLAVGCIQDKYLVMLATPLGTLSNIGFSATTAMITGDSEESTTKSANALEDQGTLLGVVFSVLVACGLVGPALFTPLLTILSGWSMPGVPYLILAVALLPAWVASARLCSRPYN
jgi:hypothetical protein